MSSLNILELIKKRTRYPMGNRIGDAWVDEILQRDDEMTYLITTENLSTLMGIQGRNKRRILFETYHISGIFGLSNPMAGTAVSYTHLDVYKRQRLEWMKNTEMAVIISQEQNEVATFEKWGLDIKPHRSKMEKREMDKEFKDPDNPFRIVFVCAMWLTGFDVKCLSTIYLDKPLKAHTLMQTIARAVSYTHLDVYKRQL